MKVALLPSGSIPALVMPMLDGGAIDWAFCCAPINWHAEVGSNAIVVAGSTGKSTTLTMDKHTLLGFAILSGLAATTTGRLHCVGNSGREFADTLFMWDLPRTLAMIPSASHATAGHLVHQAYATGFAVALGVAAVCSAGAALIVLGLIPIANRSILFDHQRSSVDDIAHSQGSGGLGSARAVRHPGVV